MAVCVFIVTLKQEILFGWKSTPMLWWAFGNADSIVVCEV